MKSILIRLANKSPKDLVSLCCPRFLFYSPHPTFCYTKYIVSLTLPRLFYRLPLEHRVFVFIWPDSQPHSDQTVKIQHWQSLLLVSGQTVADISEAAYCLRLHLLVCSREHRLLLRTPATVCPRACMWAQQQLLLLASLNYLHLSWHSRSPNVCLKKCTVERKGRPASEQLMWKAQWSSSWHRW